MSPLATDFKGVVNERLAIVAIALLLILMWSLDQASEIAVVILGGAAATFLVRIEVKRRMESLSLRRSEAQRRKRHEQGIRSVRAQALNSLPSPILLIGRDHKIIFANTEAVSMLGPTIIGEDAFLYLRQPSVVQFIDKALEAGDVSDEMVRYTSSNDRAFDVTIAPVSSANDPQSKTGEAEDDRQVMVFFYEVTSLLRTERMRVDFVANASHELRTPLSSLMGSIETLQGPARDDPEGQARFLMIMQKEAERMARLIDDLLSLSRIEMARHQTPAGPVDMPLVIASAVSSIAPQAEKRGIAFAVNVDRSLPLVIADEDQITQVLINLLFNASKYADRDTTVHVSAKATPTGKYITFSIRDEGPGIAAEHLARLTERFYRVDTARSRQMGGTGLGLAIVKHILLRHDSQLDIKSAVGVGSTFSFRLKLADIEGESLDIGAREVAQLDSAR